MPLKYHPLANLFPMIDDVAFVTLLDDIRENGMLKPIILLDDKILDGRNRYRAACVIASESGDPENWYYHSEPYIDNDPLGYILSINLHRRHLNESQRAMVAMNLAKISNNSEHTSMQVCIENAAKMLNVSERSTKTAKRIIKHGVKELQQRVKDGNVSVKAAEEISKLPKKQQREIVKTETEKQVAVKKRAEKKERPPITGQYKVTTVKLRLCEYCLDGNAGHCQVEECALYKRQSPDFPIDNYEALSAEIIDTFV